MRMRLARVGVLLAMLAATGAAAAPPRPGASPLTLTPDQRARLAALGWPPPPPKIFRREDMVLRRADPPVFGSLASLHAFATVRTAKGEVHVPRDAITFVLLDSALIPLRAPVLPLDSDAVLLVNGRDVLSGRVEVDGETIHVGAHTVSQRQAALIHLHDPKAASGQQGAAEAGGGGGAADGGTGTNGATGAAGGTGGAAGQSPGGKPKGPDKIPWGQAVWRGTLQFETIPSSLLDRETGRYYLTFSEEVVGKAPYISAVKLVPTSLVYNYHWAFPRTSNVCSEFDVSLAGSGLDAAHPNLHSNGMMYLPMPYAASHAGEYMIHILSPAQVPPGEIPRNCSANGRTYSVPDRHDLPYFSFGQYRLAEKCTSSVPARLRASAPYTTIAGDLACGTPGRYGYVSMKWQFDRGVPPPKFGGAQDPCETPRGLLSLAQDQRQAAAERLKQIGEEFSKTRKEEARLRATRDQMQPAMDLLIVAAAGSDLGNRLMKLVLGDEMLATAVETGSITSAQKDFIGQLNNFISSYEQWTAFADDPSGWGQSKLLGQAEEDVVGKEHMALINGALEMVQEGQVLADALGQGNGEAAEHYIDDNLSAFGPLVPPEVIAKAHQYVDVTREWSGSMRELAQLAGEGARLAAQIAQADLDIAALGSQSQDCK